jgi:hypothetical protein
VTVMVSDYKVGLKSFFLSNRFPSSLREQRFI